MDLDNKRSPSYNLCVLEQERRKEMDALTSTGNNQVNEVRPSEEMLESYRDEQTAIFETVLSDYTPTDPTAAAATEGTTEGV